MSYYKNINGKNLDARLLEIAEQAVQGAGDGRISKADAELLITAVQDSGNYTDIEKSTMEYIRDNFKWTENADEWFRSSIASWAQK